MSLSDTTPRQEARDAPTTPRTHTARRATDAPCQVVVYDREQKDTAWVQGQTVSVEDFR